MIEETNNNPGGQNEPPKSRMDLNNVAKKITGGHKTSGIIISICMVVLGVLLFIKPVYSAIGLAYIVTIGFIVYGVYEIIAYFRTPADYRNGWTIANGIIFALLGVLILIDSFGITGKVAMIETFAFIIGFFALFGGITQISSYGVFKKSGEPGSGWILASGIINLILGILIIIAPFAGVLTININFGIYLVIGGIALFAEACSGKLARKQ